MEGLHIGETIGQPITELIKEFELQKMLGVYVGDNARNINTAVRFLVRRFHPEEAENPLARRLRCFSYIINLAAKVFLFRNDYEAFIDDIKAAERVTVRDE